jgi:hypothetical protein
MFLLLLRFVAGDGSIGACFFLSPISPSRLCCVCWSAAGETLQAFAEPSDGLEPSTSSLPCARGSNWSQPTATVFA